MPMYNKSEMAESAAKYGFQRDTFEKVLRLKKVLESFQQDRLLNKHLVLKAVHPSPLSAYRGFFGCKHFSQANNYLISKGLTPINW